MIPGVNMEKYFRNITEYNLFKEKVMELLNTFKEKYEYLALTSKGWDTLLAKAIMKTIPNPSEMKVEAILKKYVNSYIKKEIEENRTRILANLLVILRRTNSDYKMLLKSFFEELEKENMEISVNYFNLLKVNVPLLEKMLIDLGISNYNLVKIKGFVNQSLDFYDMFPNLNYTLEEKKKILDYLISFIANSKTVKEKIIDGTAMKEHQKISLIYNNYLDILLFQKLVNEQFPDITTNLIFEFIMNSYTDKNENLINRFKDYQLNPSNDSLLYNFANKIKKYQAKEDGTTFIKVRKSLYERFPLIEGLTEEEKRAVIDFLMQKESSENQELIKDYIAGEISYQDKRQRQAFFRLDNIRKIYLKHGREIIKDNSTFLNLSLNQIARLKVSDEEKNTSKKVKSLELEFPNIEGITEEEKVLIIDILLKRESIETQELINNYLKGMYPSKSKEYQNANYKINSMGKIYLKYGKEILSGNDTLLAYKYRFYNRFPLIEGVTEEDKKLIADILFQRQSKEIQELITNYLKGNIKKADTKYRQANYYIQNMLKIYFNFGKEILTNKNILEDISLTKIKNYKKKKSLYERFPILDKIMEEERNLIVDILFQREDRETQELITEYIKGNISYQDKRYQIANCKIDNMRKTYLKYGREILSGNDITLASIYRLYNRFPLVEDITEEERNLIVDLILKNKSVKEQELIINYLKGNITKQDKRYKIVNQKIDNMRKKYFKYGKEILTNKDILLRTRKKDSIKTVKSLYDYFPLMEDITEEERILIVDNLFQSESIENQELITNYLNRVFTTKDREYQIANYKINSLRRAYFKYRKEILNDKDISLKTKIYNKFPLINDLTIEERNLIVDTLISKCSLEFQTMYKDYLKGELKFNDKRYSDFANYLKSIVRIYKIDYQKILNADYKLMIGRIPKNTIYDYFPNIEGVTEEEKVLIIDVLLGELTKKNQELIRDLVNKTIDVSCKDKVNGILRRLKRKYLDYNKLVLTSVYLSSIKPKDIYLDLKITSNMTKQEIDKIIDIDIFFNRITLLIEQVYHIEIEDISFRRKRILYDALRVLEYKYREEGMSKEEYQTYFKRVLLEVFNTNMNLEVLMLKFMERERQGAFLKERTV